MNKLKYIITIMCSSFTFVVMFNVFFNLVAPQSFSAMSSHDILEIFVICLMIAVVIMLGYSFRILRNHFYIYTYIVMLLFACGFPLIFYHYELMHILIEVAFLTLVWIGVWSCVYCVHHYDARLINEKIKKRHQ